MCMGFTSLEFKFLETRCAEGILVRADRLSKSIVELVELVWGGRRQKTDPSIGGAVEAGRTSVGKVMVGLKVSAKWTFFSKTG